MEGNYILPAELVVLMLVWYVPPILVSAAIHVSVFKKLGISKSTLLPVLVTIFIMAVISFVLGFYALVLPQGYIPSWLGATDSMLIMPMAFIVVGFTSLLTLLGAKIYVRQ